MHRVLGNHLSGMLASCSPFSALLTCSIAAVWKIANSSPGETNLSLIETSNILAANLTPTKDRSHMSRKILYSSHDFAHSVLQQLFDVSTRIIPFGPESKWPINYSRAFEWSTLSTLTSLTMLMTKWEI